MKDYLIKLGRQAKKALVIPVSSKKKDKVLRDYCNLISNNQLNIIRENKKDLKQAQRKKLKENLIERLLIDKKKILQIVNSVKLIRKFKDPVNQVIESWKRPNGLKISKVTTSIGVVAVIYESRPNVTSDVACLCFKSGNSVILKGGSEAFNSNLILSKLFRQSLKKNKVDMNYVQFIEIKKRKVVDFLLTQMHKYIDVIIPRGGKNLVKKVQTLSNIPTIGHLEGVCHSYVDKDANPITAQKVIHNAKLRNTAICGATETVLLHEKIIKRFATPILKKLENDGCKIIGDNKVKKFYKGKVYKATTKDWSKEYLSSIVSVKSVKNLEEAIDHINKYGTMHTDCIITENKRSAKKFLDKVKSSITMQNTSTQFADGGEFGFGGEIGISTSTLPPRGPVGLKQLVSYKYKITSKGKIRK